MSDSEPEKLFRKLLRDLRPICATHGFAKRSQNFVTESAECWGIINFQKSRYSDVGSISFTVNVAVAAKRVIAFYDEPIDRPPVHYAAHWQERIGSLIPGHDDVWWALSSKETYSDVQLAVSAAVQQYAIPAVSELLTEDALLELWRRKHAGGFEYSTLKYRAVLLAERGLIQELGPVLFRIVEMTAGRIGAQAATDHVMKLKARYRIPDRLA